jgi:hypothetical protein
MDAFQILVVILSVFLSIALLLTIIVLVYVLKLVKSVKQISEKAAAVVDSASNISKFVSPTVAGKYVFDAVQKAINNHKKEK